MACIVKAPKNNQADYDYIAFSYNGYHSFEDLKIYRVSNGSRYEDSLAPNIENKTATVEGYNGEYLFDTFHRRRQFNIKIAFDNLYEEDYQRLKKVFRGDEMGELWFAEYPFKVYDVKLASPMQLNVIPFDAPDGSGRRLYKGEGEIQFIAPYPYAHTPDMVQRWNETTYVDVGVGTNYNSYAYFKNRAQWKDAFERNTDIPCYFTAEIKEASAPLLFREIAPNEVICIGPKYDKNPFSYQEYDETVPGMVWKTMEDWSDFYEDIHSDEPKQWYLRIPETFVFFGEEFKVTEIAGWAFSELSTDNEFLASLPHGSITIMLPESVTTLRENSFAFEGQGSVVFEGACNIQECHTKSFSNYDKLNNTDGWLYIQDNSDNLNTVILKLDETQIDVTAETANQKHPTLQEITIPTIGNDNTKIVIATGALRFFSRKVSKIDLSRATYINDGAFDISAFTEPLMNSEIVLPFLGNSTAVGKTVEKIFSDDIYDVKSLTIKGGILVDDCCRNLKIKDTLLLGKSIISIPNRAFYNSKILKIGTWDSENSVEYNQLYVTNIGDSAFYGNGCKSNSANVGQANVFEEIKISPPLSGQTLTIGPKAFANTRLTKFVIDNGFTTITLGQEILSYREDRIKSEKNDVFEEISIPTTGLENFKLGSLFAKGQNYSNPDNTSNGFYCPSSFKTATFYGNIPNGFCKGIVSLENVTIYNNNTGTIIGESSFEGCEKLQNLHFWTMKTLPLSNIYFGSNAFKDCSQLHHSAIKSSWEAWLSHTFDNAQANPLSNKSNLMFYNNDTKTWQPFHNFYGKDVSTTLKNYAFAGYNSIQYSLNEEDQVLDLTSVVKNVFEGATFNCLTKYNFNSDTTQFVDARFNKEIVLQQKKEASLPQLFKNCRIKNIKIILSALPTNQKLADFFDNEQVQSITSTIDNLILDLSTLTNRTLPSRFFEGLSGDMLSIIVPELSSQIKISGDYKNLFTKGSFGYYALLRSNGDDTYQNISGEEEWYECSGGYKLYCLPQEDIVLTGPSDNLICNSADTICPSVYGRISTDNQDWSNVCLVDLTKVKDNFIFEKGDIPSSVRVVIDTQKHYTMYYKDGENQPDRWIDSEKMQENLRTKDANFWFKGYLKSASIVITNGPNPNKPTGE